MCAMKFFMLETKVEMSIFVVEGFINNGFKININILLNTVLKNVEIEAGSSPSRHVPQLQCTTWMLCLEPEQDEGNWGGGSPGKSE